MLLMKPAFTEEEPPAAYKSQMTRKAVATDSSATHKNREKSKDGAMGLLIPTVF